MAGVDSGGEGQNPKYVALLAGFAMLYMQQTNRDSKIALFFLMRHFQKWIRSEAKIKAAGGLPELIRQADELEKSGYIRTEKSNLGADMKKNLLFHRCHSKAVRKRRN